MIMLIKAALGLRTIALSGAVIALGVAATQLASCQTRLLYAGAAEGRAALMDAIADDDRALGAKNAARLEALLAMSERGRAEQSQIAAYYSALVGDGTKTEGAEDLACPTPEQWAAWLHCAPPRSR